MRMYVIAFLLAFLLAAFSVPGLSEQSVADKSAVQQLREQTNPEVFEWLQMETEAAIIQASWGAGTDPYKSLDVSFENRRAKIKEVYALALAEVAGKPAVSKLLKEYYVVWMAAMDGVKPLGAESKIANKMRQGESLRRISEAWYRLEAEAGL